MSTRRQFLGVLLPLIGVCALSVSGNVLARRGRIRFHGHGLSGSSNYSGSVLSRAQLKSCVMQEQSINATMDRLDQEEAYINQQQAYVDNYSQQSVDTFNQAVDRFNTAGEQANAQVAAFNSSCANQAYYESDMTAVREELLQKARVDSNAAKQNHSYQQTQPGNGGGRVEQEPQCFSPRNAFGLCDYAAVHPEPPSPLPEDQQKVCEERYWDKVNAAHLGSVVSIERQAKEERDACLKIR